MRVFMISMRCSLVLMLLCGLGYSYVVTGIAQSFAPEKANGSLIYNSSKEVIGSSLIGQTFVSPGYFHGRISSIAYNGISSGSPNYAPSNEDLIKRMRDSITEWEANNPNMPADYLPMDLITNSASGLDPHISPEAAIAQVNRISETRDVQESRLVELVKEHTSGRELGFLGERRVNVLELNVALDAMDQ